MHQLLTAALLLASLATAQAATIYRLDFESGNLPTGTFMDIAGGMNADAFADTANSAGVASSNALVATYDTGGSASYFRYEFTAGSPLATATSDNPADYTVSFDIRAVGLLVSPSSGDFTLIFNNFFTRIGGVSFGLTDTFQRVSFTLDEFSPVSGAFSAAEASTNLGFLFEVFGTATKFGNDNGNQIIVDNFSLTQASAIPEPASFAALAGIGALALGTLRRRRRACIQSLNT